MDSKKSPIEKEWIVLIKSEEKFQISRMSAKPRSFNGKIDKYVPDKFRSVLNTAFNKAFTLVFEKGSGVIGKTYDKEEYEYKYKVKEYALKLKESKKNIKRFSRKASIAKSVNMLISGVSGVGMGIAGIGIPDIPIFTLLVLRSIYEIAMSFGFDYENENEQIFILKLIEVSMKDGIDFANENSEVNKLIDNKEKLTIAKEEQINNTSKVLADSMIYMKFLQGVPIVGLVGGLYDFLYMDRISTYAYLKYKRKFFIKSRAEKLPVTLL